MKKMLAMLFLLFCLNIPNPLFLSGGETDVKAMIERDNKEIVYNKHLVYREEGKVREAYHNWEGIPISSPLKMGRIKRISSDYGHRIHPIFLKWMMHYGIDFSAEKGTTVYSTATGTVTKVKRSRLGYGNEIVIRHSNGYSTRYAHLDSIFVKKGQLVYNTTYIGTVGSSGLSTGPHLHYEILRNNRPIDPMYFTYGTKDHKRSKQNYLDALIALESQQEVDKFITLGVHPIRYAQNVQVVSSSKIN